MKIRSKSSLVHRRRPVKRQGEGRSSFKFNLVHPWLLHHGHVSTKCKRKRTVASQVQPLWNADLNNLTFTAVMEVTSELFGLLNNRNGYQTSNRSPHAIWMLVNERVRDSNSETSNLLGITKMANFTIGRFLAGFHQSPLIFCLFSQDSVTNSSTPETFSPLISQDSSILTDFFFFIMFFYIEFSFFNVV